MMRKLGEKNKRGQMTLFIIIGIVIVALALLIYFFFPQIKSTFGFSAKNPEQQIQSCLEKEIENSAKALSLNGGSLNPENYINYDNSPVEYLCYQEDYYLPCVMQQPLLVEHIQDEIKNAVQEKANECFDAMVGNYEKSGYSVSTNKGDLVVELLPDKIIVTLENSLTLTKNNQETYKSFKVVVNKKLYELAILATSILNWEARYGDSETTSYMNYYHDVKVEKKKQSDGSTIYILTDRNTGDKFQFASRSVAWPPGYGSAEVTV